MGALKRIQIERKVQGKIWGTKVLGGHKKGVCGRREPTA